MSYAVFLLCLVLIGAAASETTTSKPQSPGEVAPLEKEGSLKPILLKEDNSTEPEEVDGEDDDSMASAESQGTFKFTRADAVNKARSKPPEDAEEGEEEDANDEDTAKIIKELTALVGAQVQLMNDTENDPNIKTTKVKEQDIESEEDGEEDGDPFEVDDEDEEETADSKPEESQIKRQDEQPNFKEDKASRLDFDQPNRQGEIPAPPAEEYVTVNVQPENSNSESDNSPLLQLTQGGYRPPFDFSRRNPRVRAQSTPQQSETVENPISDVNNDEQFRQPQTPPQVSYADPFQTQFGFSSALGLRHPFIPPDSFVNSNGMVHQPVQNGFFNAPPAGFTDFTGTNFQAPFSPSNDGGYQVFPRNPSGISLFQASPEHLMHSPGFMVQNQQYPQTQFLATGPTQPTSNLYPAAGFINYPGSENPNVAPRPDYSPFFRSQSPNNLRFQANNNPFAPPRNAAGMVYNPMPNFPNRPQYSPQYPAPNPRVQAQSNAPEERKQKDVDKISEGETTKTEEQVKASPNKEDSPSIPYGVRIQRQNGPEPQGDFPPQADVYMRYPVKDAGYATEESLPVQNTTTKTETKRDPPPPRQIFSLFQGPGQFGDPYRNALNAVQQSFAADSNARNKDESNRTKEPRPRQIPPRMLFPFNPSTLARPLPGYPDSRNLNSPPMSSPDFFRAVDGPAVDPFDQLGDLPDRFPEPILPVSQSQEAPVLPACVHGQANASVCFEDPEYPKRDVLFALNSDPYMMERFSMPDQQLDTISLVEQDLLEQPENPANYICDSKIKYGFPLRAKDVNGQWKVIVNIEKDVGQGRFVQPVRLEMCNGAGDPCNFTEVKTACVQKYNLHRLLSWSPEKGVHNDVFKLPVACSCQLIETQA